MMYLIYRFGRWLALSLSLDRAYKVAVFLSDVFYTFAKADRADLERNLSIALNREGKNDVKQIARRVYRNFGKYLVDFFRFSMIDSKYIMSNIKIEGKEKLDKAMARGKGGIVLTAHIGSWELGGAIIASLGYPFYAIALDHKDKKINKFFVKQRKLADVRVISIGAQLKQCFKVLKDNHLLAIVGDRDFSNNGLMVDFFGRKAILPKGPAFFSIKTGAPIISTFMIREEDDKCKLVFDDPIMLSNAELTKNREENIKILLKKCMATTEKFIRMYPDQWYAFRRVWK